MVFLLGHNGPKRTVPLSVGGLPKPGALRAGEHRCSCSTMDEIGTACMASGDNSIGKGSRRHRGWPFRIPHCWVSVPLRHIAIGTRAWSARFGDAVRWRCTLAGVESRQSCQHSPFAKYLTMCSRFFSEIAKYTA